MIKPTRIVRSFFPDPYVIDPWRNFLRSIKELYLFQSWKTSRDYQISKRNLSIISNKYAGKKAVVLCNGPSLLKTDLELLADVYTIGLNKINLLFDYSNFVPSCIVAVNSYVIEQNKDFYKKTQLPLFLAQKPSRGVHINANSTRTLLFSSSGSPGFSTDPRFAISQGATVTYVALQLAYYLGFKYVALVGCDHNFETKGPDHQLVESGEVDPNHFDPRYFSGGVPWQLPSIAESEESYMKAKRFYEYDDRSIYNCTTGGKLELFPRISLQQFMEI